MLELLAIYAVIGACFVTMLALGVGRIEVHAELLGREVPRSLIIGCALAGAFIAWPVVLWLLVLGRREAGTVQLTERAPEMQHGE